MYNRNDRGNNSGNRRYGGRPKPQGGGQKSVNPEKFSFVPFSENVLAYPDEWGGIPPENVLDPALASGEIHITLKAETPLYVSDGERGDFYKLPSGEYAIPGASVRGMVYTNMQILSYGLVRAEDIGKPEKDKIAYENGLPQSHRDAQKKPSPVLDFPHAMMGYVLSYRDEKGQPQTDTRRSRISFGDCKVNGAPERLGERRIAQYSPNLSKASRYTLEGQYIDKKTKQPIPFHLRGYKLYWLQERASFPKPSKPEEAKQGNKAEIRINPMVRGTTFSGVVRYKNLHPEELGLLLWALALEKGCYQSIGLGKPCGLGRVTLTIDRLVEYDYKKLYAPASFTGGAVTVEQPSDLENYIRQYRLYASKVLGAKEGIRREPEIRDFFYLHRLHPKRSTILSDLKQYDHNAHPTVAEIRERDNDPNSNPEPEVELPEMEPSTVAADEEMLQKLVGHFRGGLVESSTDTPSGGQKKAGRKKKKNKR